MIKNRKASGRRILAGVLAILVITMSIPLDGLTFAESLQGGTGVTEETVTGETVTGETVAEVNLPIEEESIVESNVPQMSAVDENKSEHTTASTEENIEEVSLTETVEEGDTEAFLMSQDIDDITITVSADAGVFPNGTSLHASKVLKESEAAAIDEAIEAVREDDKNVNESYTFDIRMEDQDGNEIEPDTTKGKVHVSFVMSKAVDENREIEVYHVKESTDALVAEALDTSKDHIRAEETVVTVETDSFSYYVVEFTIGDLEYVLDGDLSIPLSAILSELSLTGTVTAAVSSDESLFKVTKDMEGDDWTLDSICPFTSDETLTVTIQETEYVIQVTDSVTPLTTLSTSQTLSTGRYLITKSQTLSASTGQSGLYISGNVVLAIADGVTLTVYGGNGSGRTGGGAGISVPSGSSLTITGTGSLYAYGGKGGSGQDGEPGPQPYTVNSSLYSGGGVYKGNGGYGGGGAGAGIGGSGGTGGTGGIHSDCQIFGIPEGKVNGEDGGNGNPGGTGVTAGSVTILNQVYVSASGGGAGGAGSGGTPGAEFSGVGLYLGGGGGGGGGGQGQAADGIGGGGGGGGGGGAGGYGGTNGTSKASTVQKDAGGSGGGGGAPNGAGAPGGADSTNWHGGGDNGGSFYGGSGGSFTTSDLDCSGGVGGSGGRAGYAGGNEGISRPASDSNFAVTVTLDTQNGISTTTSVTAYFGKSMSSVSVPTRYGYTFAGYYAGTKGTGTKYYNADGTGASMWDKDSAATIYADWTPLPYDVLLDGTNVIQNTGFGMKTAAHEQIWTGSITAADNYYLPENISIQTGNVTLTADTDYTYDSFSGAVTIKPGKIVGTVTVTANTQTKVFTTLSITEGMAADNGGTEIVNFLTDSANGDCKLTPGKDYYLNVTMNKKTGVDYVQVQYGLNGYNGATFTNPPGGTFNRGSITHDYLDKLEKYTDWGNPPYGSSTAKLALTDGTLIYHMEEGKDTAKFALGLNINDAVYNGSGHIDDAISIAAGKYESSSFTQGSGLNLGLNVVDKNKVLCRMVNTTSNAVLDGNGNTIYAYAITNYASTDQAAALYDQYQVDLVYPKNADLFYGFNTNFDKKNTTYGTMTLGDAQTAPAQNGIEMQKRTLTIVNGYKPLTSTISAYFRLDFKSAYFGVGKYTMSLSNPKLSIGGTALSNDSIVTTSPMTCTYTVTKGGTDAIAMSAVNRPSVYNQTLDMPAGSYMVPLGAAYIKNGSDSFDTPYEKTFEAQYNTENAAANVSLVLIPLGTSEEPVITWEGKDASGNLESGTLSAEQVSDYAYTPGDIVSSKAILLYAKDIGVETITKVTAKIGCIRKGYASSTWTSGWSLNYNYAGAFGYFTDGSNGTVVKNTYHLFNTEEEFRGMTGGDLTVNSTATATNEARVGMNSGNIKLGNTTLKTDSSVAAGQTAKISGTIYPYIAVQAAYEKRNGVTVSANSMMVKGLQFYLMLPYGITPNDENGGISFTKTTYSYTGKSLGTTPVSCHLVQEGDIRNGITPYKVTIDSSECIGFYDENGNSTQLNYTLSFHTDESLTTQRYRLNDLIKVVTDNHTEFLPYAGVNSGTLIYAGEDTYQLNGGKKVSGVAKDKDDLQMGFGVQQLADISVQSAISVSKINNNTVEKQEWYAYNISNPNSIAMLGQKSEGQIRLTINNTSDNTASDVEMVLPIPQINMNLGKLFMENAQGFTVDMTNAVQSGSADGFDVTYGKITGSYADAAAFYEGQNHYTEVSNQADANALIIRAASLQKGIYNLYFNYMVKDGGVDTVDIWRPIYQYKINGDTRRKVGSDIASSIAGSEINGVVFQDADRNKVMSNDENGIDGVVVTAKDTQGRIISTVTEADGTYQFEAVREAVITMTFTLPNGRTYRFNVGALEDGGSQIATTVIPSADGMSATQQLFVSGTGNMVNAAVSDYFALSYNGNGSTAGSLPVNGEYVDGDTAVVSVKPDNLVKTGCRFVCWNTAADGKGTDYLPGNTFEMKSNTVLYAKWTTASYLVTFNYRGATASNTESNRSLYYNSYFGGTSAEYKSKPLPVPSKAGYLFKGWATSATTTSVIGNTTRFRTGADLILYAVWTERADYKVHYDTTGGTEIADRTIAYTGNVVSDQTPLKTGYLFKAWKYNNTEVTKEDTYQKLAGDVAEITLTALWEPKTGFQVNYNTAGGRETIAAKNVAWTDTGLLPQGNPTRAGFAFEGWTFNGAAVGMEDTYALLAGSDTVSAIELTATWSELTDNMVKYNTAGGSAIKDKNGVKASDTGLLPETNPVKAGYTFNGWKCGNISVTNTTKYSALSTESSITLMAQWTEKSYVVKYQTNTTQSIAQKNKKWTEDKLIPETVLTRTGYQFAGWSFEDSSVNYNSTIEMLLPADDRTEVLFSALWNELSYTIVYDANGGSYIMPKTGILYTQTNIQSDAAPVKTGYVFDGWYAGTKLVSGTTSCSEVAALAVGNKITLTAHWTPKTGYYVGYNTDGGTTIADKENVTWNETSLLPTGSCEKAGYTLTGWLVGRKSVTAQTPYADLATEDTLGSKITMVAQWQEKADYRIIYHTECDTQLADKTGVRYTEKQLLPVTALKMEGYAFKGWQLKDGTSVSNADDYRTLLQKLGETASTKDIELYASWELKNEYVVSYDTGGGGSFSDKNSVAWNDSRLIPAELPAKEGYQFTGWYLNGKKIVIGTKYQELVENDEVMSVTFTAGWQLKRYTVSYETGTALKVDAKTDVTWIDENLLPNVTPQITGYDFKGWYYKNREITDKDCLQSLFQNETIPENITLTAEWEIHSYAMTLDTSAPGYQIKAVNGSDKTAEYQSDYYVAVELEDGYSKTGSFELYAKKTGETDASAVSLSADEGGIYEIKNVTADMTIFAKGIADITAPTGEIVLGTNHWNSFLNKVTFGLFFNNTQSVAISGEDSGSGIDKIAYFVSDSALSAEEVKAVSEWTTYSQIFSIAPDSSCVIYAKIIDESGNTTYLNSNGMVLDETLPAIGGIENNGTYYGTQNITITDDYLSSVTVNDAEIIYALAEGEYSLKPAKKPYHIVAVDKAGNQTDYQITVNWREIAIPVPDDQEYTGELQRAQIFDCGDYTVTANEGGINKGTYQVLLSLNDTTENKWSGKEGGVADAAASFHITAVTNKFINGLSCNDVVYGNTPQPHAVTKYGTVIYKYATSEAGTYQEEVPTEVDTYYVKAYVNGTEDYAAITSNAVSFKINKAVYEKPAGLRGVNETIDQIADGMLCGVTTQMEYSTDNGQSWTAIGGAAYDAEAAAQKNLAAGTYLVRMREDESHIYSESESILIESGRKLQVTFHAAGSTDIIKEVSYQDSLNAEQMPAVPVKNGYTGKGWCIGDSSTVVSAITNVTDDMICNARYDSQIIAIQLQNGAGAIPDSGDIIYLKYADGYYTDAACTSEKLMNGGNNAVTLPNRTGYVFLGYYTGPNQTGELYVGADGYLTDKARVRGFSSAGVLYAAWEEETYGYHVSVDSSHKDDVIVGGISAADKDIRYTDSNTVSISTNAGYTIQKIYLYVDGVLKNTISDPVIPYEVTVQLSNLDWGVGDVDIAIDVTVDTHTITYKNEGNTAFKGAFTDTAPTQFTQIYGTALPQAERTGYVFDGWFSDSDCSNRVTKIEAQTTNDVTVYAKWIPEVYIVTMHTAGGSFQENKELTQFTFQEDAVTALPTAADIQKEGYTFDGWYGNEEFLGSKITTIPAGAIGAKDYYAKWLIKQYDVTLTQGTGYHLTAVSDSHQTAYGMSYRFEVAPKSGYSKTAAFKVMIKNTNTEEAGQILQPDADGYYTISNMNADKTVWAEGIEDVLAPDGVITIRENHFSQFLNQITFGIFFKNTQQVHVSATDNGSGMASTKYYVAAEKISETDIKETAPEKWTAFAGPAGGSFNLAPNCKAVVYVCMVDQDGNEKYISSEGMVYENAAPNIDGVTNGETRVVDGDVRVTVTDQYLKEVVLFTGDTDLTGTAQSITGTQGAVNNQMPTAELVLKAPVTGQVTYRIEATDQADNHVMYSLHLIRANYDLKITMPVLKNEVYGYADISACPITITSLGNKDTVIQSVGLSGADAQKFVLNQVAGITLGKGAVNNTAYSIRPKTGLPAGTYYTTFTITNQDGRKTEETAVFTVEAKEAVLKWSEKEFIYNGQIPQITAQITNIEAGDSCNVNVTVDTGVVPGTYTDKAVAVSLTNTNYKLPANNKLTYVIKNDDITGITITPYVGILDTSKHDSIVSIDGVKTNDRIEYYLMAAGQWTGPYSRIPQVGSVGSTDIRVKIYREYYNTYEEIVTAVIKSGPSAKIGIPVYHEGDATQVTVKAEVVKGSWELAEQKFAYRASGEEEWTDIATVGNDVTLTNLMEDTVYELKLSATDEDQNTVTDNRKFKTNTQTQDTGSIIGSVTGNEAAVFMVSLELGSTTIASAVNLSKDEVFRFDNLADGEYNLIATDGTYKVTRRVNVRNGETTNIPVIVIANMQTSVEIVGNAPSVTVDDLNQLFYSELIQNDEEALFAIENEGSVEIKLKAEITEDASKAVVNNEIDTVNNTVGLYVDFIVNKIITNNGELSEISTVDDTKELILIAIPLPQAAQNRSGYKVYRNHKGTISQMTELADDERDNPTKEGFYIEDNCVYVWARFFSTYAVSYYTPVIPPDPDDDVSQSTDEASLTDLGVLKKNVINDISKNSMEIVKNQNKKQENTLQENTSDSLVPINSTDDIMENITQDTEEPQTDIAEKGVQTEDCNTAQASCFWHWLILALLVIFAIFCISVKKDIIMTRVLLGGANIILACIFAILGSCGLDWWFFAGDVLITIAGVFLQRILKRK